TSVSLDARAHANQAILATARRYCVGCVRSIPCGCKRGPVLGSGFLSWARATGFCSFDLWLPFPIPGVSTLRGARMGAPGSSFDDVLCSCRCSDFLLSHGRCAGVVAFRVTSNSPLAD